MVLSYTVASPYNLLVSSRPSPLYVSFWSEGDAPRFVKTAEDKDGSHFTMANKPLGFGAHGKRTRGKSWPASNNL